MHVYLGIDSSLPEMNSCAIFQEEVNVGSGSEASTIAPKEDLIRVGGANTKGPTEAVILAVGPGQRQRNDIGENQVGFSIDKQSGPEIYRVATVGMIPISCY